MLEIALITKLATIAANIYPTVAPLNFQTPMVIYNRISTDPSDDLDGSPDHAFCMVQVDIYDASKLTAMTLAGQIRQGLCAWSGDGIQGASLHDERDWIYDTTQSRLYRISQDYLIYTALD